MNIFSWRNSNLENLDSFSNFNEDQVQSTFSYTINIIEKETSSLWDQMYCSYLPPAIGKDKLCEIPIFFKKHSKKFLMNSQKCFYNHQQIPFCNFILGMYHEYFIEFGKITQETLEIYKRGAKKNDPFCMLKIAENLLKENETSNLRVALTFLIKSFLITSIESYRFIPENLLLSYHNDYFNMDSFWYLAFYFETQNTLFLEVLIDLLTKENCSNEFYECLKYIFTNLYKIEELVNILKILEDCYKKDQNTITAYHFCMFSFFISRIANLPVNFEYISLILKNIADQGNFFACEKYGFFLDAKKDYRNAFLYFSKAQENFLPHSILSLGNYFCSLKNPSNCVDMNKAAEFYKKASYLGFSNLMEYIKIMEINKEYDELFNLANYSYSCGIFGGELVLGECYEKGRGIEKNLFIAISLYKRGLRKHKGGSGFLYRLSRILEKSKNELYKEFYKISFALYLQFYEKDKNSEDNIWILDAYRIASMLGSGRGIGKEPLKAYYFIDLILKANVNSETSSYTCLYQFLLKMKQNGLINQTSLSSVLPNEPHNSIHTLDYNNNYFKNNDDIRISYLSKINEEGKTKANKNNEIINCKVNNEVSNNNNNNNNKVLVNSHGSDFNLGSINESSDRSIKIEILSNSQLKRKLNLNEYIKILPNENFKKNEKEVQKEIEMVISDPDREMNKDSHFNSESIQEENKPVMIDSVSKNYALENEKNNYGKKNEYENINFRKNKNNLNNNKAADKFLQPQNEKLNKINIKNNSNNFNSILNAKLSNQLIGSPENKINNNILVKKQNNNFNRNIGNIASIEDNYVKKPSILQLTVSNDDINFNNNLKSSNLSMTILTDSDNSCFTIEDFFLSNLKLISKKRENIKLNNKNRLITENQLKSISNNTNSNNNHDILLEDIELKTEEIVKIKKIFKKLKSNGINFIELNDLIYDELLANGGYSKVYSGWHKEKKVAIKDFKNISIENITKIFQEIQIQSNLKHDKINRILYVGLDTSPIKICCINKFMPYNLRSILLNAKLDISQKLYITHQIFEAISYLHSQAPPIVHRDLKPENILIDNDLNLELCDFGIYKLITEEKSKTNTENRIFTVRYAPPEVINSLNFICKGSDIWSLGLILYDLFYENQPWFGLSSDDIINAVKKQRPFLVKNNKNVPSKIITIIKQCTNYEYDQRPKINDLLFLMDYIIKEFLH
jgi:TPR repeat protein